MNRIPPRNVSHDELIRQRERATEIKIGMRDLRKTLERLRDVEELYDEIEQAQVASQPQALPDSSGDAAASSQREAVMAAQLAQAQAQAASVLVSAANQQTSLTTFQRAIERMRGQSPAERAGGSLGGGPMELLTYWKIIWKRLWLIVLLMIAGGAGMYYYVSKRPPQYRTTTTLYMNPAAASTILNYTSYDGLQAMASTYSEFMKTLSFARRVSDELGGSVGEGQVLGALSTQYVDSTQFFRITATYSDPTISQQLANTGAQVLIAQNIARQQAEQEQRQAQSKPDPERERLAQVRSNLEQELEVYNGQIAALEAQIDKIKVLPQSDANDRLLLDLQQQLVNTHSLRITAMNGLADTQASLAATANSTPLSLDTAVVVDVAPLPTAPLPTQILQYTLVAILASFALGAGIAFLIEYLDYTIKNPETMEAIYGAPSQGVIGVFKKRGRARGPAELAALAAPQSPIAEAFRVLRTNVHFANLSSPVRTLLVTSARPGEGKTFVAANLAVSLAQNGLRVILVDADLRKPSVHYMFNLALDPGFTNLVLSSELSVEAALQPTSVENLRVLTCGIVPPNPAELLGAARTAEVMEQLARYADIVIYDTPPAATVADALVIAPRVDGVLHVVQAGGTRIDLVRRCKAILKRGGAQLLGPVLNQVAVSEMRSYSSYYSHSYYSNGDRRSSRRNGHHAPQQFTAPLIAPAAANGNGHVTANGNGAYGAPNGNGSSNGAAAKRAPDGEAAAG